VVGCVAAGSEVHAAVEVSILPLVRRSVGTVLKIALLAIALIIVVIGLAMVFSNRLKRSGK
jgi:hypothetical protein